MEETTGLISRIRHHDKLAIALNENCRIPLPDEVVRTLAKPHRLSYYYFQYIAKGRATFATDRQEFTIGDGSLAFGLPNQVFTKLPYDKDTFQYALSFDETALRLLPGSYPFLINPRAVNSISFDAPSQRRVQNLLDGLFQLLHASAKQERVEVILAHLHALLTEFNTAYEDQYETRSLPPNARMSKYIAFKLAVETDLGEQHDVHSVAAKLAMNAGSLYGIVKEFAGVSPKQWITNRLMLEAQRRLQYSTVSVKELAYELGFSDPGYFSRLFRKSTGQSVTEYLAQLQDLSRN